MKAVSKFQAQRQSRTPTYACRHCGHRTRETGEDESSVELCAPCYELSGLENVQSDSGIEASNLIRSLPTILARIEQIEKRGKGDAGWRETFAELIAKGATEREDFDPYHARDELGDEAARAADPESHSASEAYAATAASIAKLIAALQATLAADAEQQKTDPRNWDRVGGLRHVERQLALLVDPRAELGR